MCVCVCELFFSGYLNNIFGLIIKPCNILIIIYHDYLYKTLYNIYYSIIVHCYAIVCTVSCILWI